MDYCWRPRTTPKLGQFTWRRCFCPRPFSQSVEVWPPHQMVREELWRLALLKHSQAAFAKDLLSTWKIRFLSTGHGLDRFRYRQTWFIFTKHFTMLMISGITENVKPHFGPSFRQGFPLDTFITFFDMLKPPKKLKQNMMSESQHSPARFFAENAEMFFSWLLTRDQVFKQREFPI